MAERPSAPRPSGSSRLAGRRHGPAAALLLTALALAVSAIGPLGCASNATTDRLEASLAEYDSGQYASAHTHATEVMESSNGVTRDAAAYVGGLSAYRLGDRAEAERLLLEAAGSSDEATAAKARTVLGLLRLEQHRPHEAIALFQAAAPQLSDEDRDKALRFATSAALGAGLDEETVTAALTLPTGQAGAGTTDDGPAFALQVGAFEDRGRAERAAADVRRLALRSGLGEPRVAARRDERGLFYLVQVGAFDSRQHAAALRASIDRPEYIVAPRTN